MPMKTRRDHNGDPLISTPSFSVAEIRELSAYAEPYPGVREYQDNEGLVRVSNDAQFYGRQLQRAHDKIYELRRDADLEIKRQRDRTSQMAICAAVGWCVAVWVSILWWLS